MSIEVVEPGILTTVQDAVGRRDWRHVGVPAGGAADPWSARLVNRLVGNPDRAALLEVTLAGPTLRFIEPALVALVGQMAATLDGLPLRPNAARPVRAGAQLRIGEGRDARAWLAVGGGLAVEPIEGYSTNYPESYGNGGVPQGGKPQPVFPGGGGGGGPIPITPTPPVPEPATMALLGSALVALLAGRRVRGK